MNTNLTNESLRRRLTAATLMAGVIAVGGLGVAGTANARPPINPAPVQPQPRPAGSQLFTAIAFSSDTGAWASWSNAASFNDANFGALNGCQNAGGSHCLLTSWARNECVALAVDAVNWEHWNGEPGPTQISAMNAALQANGGGRIATTACTVTTVNSPYPSSITATGSGNGTLTAAKGSVAAHTAPGATVVCGAIINCRFEETPVTLGVFGGAPMAAFAEAAAISLSRSGTTCPSSAKWTAKYFLNEPNTNVFVTN